MHEDEWWKISRRRWRLLAVWIIIFTIAILYLVMSNRHTTSKIHNLVIANQARIADIQKSRLDSCKTTYSVIQTLIRASASNRHFNKAQQKRFNEFLNLANPNRCEKQVKPK